MVIPKVKNRVIIFFYSTTAIIQIHKLVKFDSPIYIKYNYLYIFA